MLSMSSNSDMDIGTETADFQPLDTASRRKFRVTASAGTLAALASVVCIMALTAREEATSISATAFFEGRELAATVTDQYMKLGQHVLHPDDRQRVQDHVQASFKQVSLTARQLNSIQLTKEQQESLLHVMRYMSNPRVRAIGRDIRMAARNALEEQGSDRENLIRHVDATVTSHLRELRELAYAMFPGASVERVPRAEHLHVVRAFDEFARRKGLLAKSGAATSRRLSDEPSTLIKSIGGQQGLSQIIMNQIAQMHDGFEAPEVRKLQASPVSSPGTASCTLEQAMNTGDPSCLFEGMEADFEEAADSVMQSLGLADTTTALAAYMTTLPVVPIVPTYTTTVPGGVSTWR